MPFTVLFQITPEAQLEVLSKTSPKKYAKVLNCIGRLEINPRHPGLNSNRYENYDRTFGEKIWESYVENKTPSAHRIFWHYGPDEGEITIVAITPHP